MTQVRVDRDASSQRCERSCRTHIDALGTARYPAFTVGTYVGVVLHVSRFLENPGEFGYIRQRLI